MSVEARHRPLTASAALFALFLTGLWSGLGIAIKFGLEDAPPLRLGWLRFVLGALTVLVWALWIRADLVPKRGEALALLAVGVMFCLELATMNIGLEKTTASHAAVVLSTYSVWMAVFAHFQVPGDRLTRRKLLARSAWSRSSRLPGLKTAFTSAGSSREAVAVTRLRCRNHHDAETPISCAPSPAKLRPLEDPAAFRRAWPIA